MSLARAISRGRALKARFARERHEEGFEIVRRRSGLGGRARLGHGIRPFACGASRVLRRKLTGKWELARSKRARVVDTIRSSNIWYAFYVLSVLPNLTQEVGDARRLSLSASQPAAGPTFEPALGPHLRQPARFAHAPKLTQIPAVCGGDRRCAGEGDRLKGYTIGVEALGRAETSTRRSTRSCGSKRSGCGPRSARYYAGGWRPRSGRDRDAARPLCAALPLARRRARRPQAERIRAIRTVQRILELRVTASQAPSDPH